MSRRMFVTPSNACFYAIAREDAEEGSTNWTINEHARRGDLMALYICAPVSAIVGCAILSETPQLETDPQAEFYGKHFADVHDLRMFDRPIPRAELIEVCGDGWKYFRQPRNSVEIPPEFAARFEQMFRERGGIA